MDKISINRKEKKYKVYISSFLTSGLEKKAMLFYEYVFIYMDVDFS